MIEPAAIAISSEYRYTRVARKRDVREHPPDDFAHQQADPQMHSGLRRRLLEDETMRVEVEAGKAAERAGAARQAQADRVLIGTGTPAASFGLGVLANVAMGLTAQRIVEPSRRMIEALVERSADSHRGETEAREPGSVESPSLVGRLPLFGTPANTLRERNTE